MERPINISNFEWKSSDQQFKILKTFNFPNDFLNLPMWREKFDGFYGLRADIKFRLQVNATPFQAGRLLLAWIPYSSYRGDYGKTYIGQDEMSMVSLSGCPRRDLDISQSTECDVTIPYCSPHSHFNLATGEGTWGSLHIATYSPLVDPASEGHVDCTAWINLQAVDLAFPTGASLVTAPLIPSSTAYNADGSQIVAQVGDEERNAEEHRILSKDLGKLSDFLSPTLKVPVLSEITRPLIWCCDTASAALSFFGYSKLQSQNVPEFSKLTGAHNMATYDGVDMSHPLSFSQANSIELMPDMVGNDIDEMALHHVVSTPCYYTHFTWKGTDKAGKSLYTEVMNPASFGQKDNATNTIVPTHLYYGSAIFQYWRGSIDITLKIVKTKFHSGRLRIYFQPGTSWPNPDDPNRHSFNYSQVIDIRSQTDVVFRVPYVSTHPWLTVGGMVTASTANQFSTTGVVRVEVLNELVANSSVGADVDILVEVSAGPDFELASPCDAILVPWREKATPPPTTTPKSATDPNWTWDDQAGIYVPRNSVSSRSNIGVRKPRSLLSTIIAQVGQDESPVAEQEGINKDQLGNDQLRTQWINEACCIGEKVTSIRQLIKRAHLEYNGVAPDDKGFLINPYAFAFGAETASPATYPDSLEFSYLEYFMHIYAFWRGGMNIKIVSDNQRMVIATFGVNRDAYAYKQNEILASGSDASIACRTMQVIPTNIEGVVDLHIPYYSAFHMCPITSLPRNNLNDALGIFPKGLLQVKGYIAKDNIYVFRNATDSFQFGYLLGPPRCVRKY